MLIGISFFSCNKVYSDLSILHAFTMQLGTVKHVYSDHAYNEMTLITKH